MIIVLIALFTVCVFISFFFVKRALLRWILGCCSVALLLASVLLLCAHFAWNWGTVEVGSQQTVEIYTAGDTKAAYGVLIASQIGTKSDNYAFSYRTEARGKVGTHFVPDTSDIIDAVKVKSTYTTYSGTSASLTTTTIRRQFSSPLTKLLFGIGGEENVLVSQSNVISVPESTWLVLTEAQAKELATKAPQLQAEAEQQAKQAQATLEAEIAAAPTPEAKLQLQQAAQEQAAAQQAIENNPTEYAQQQIAAIKTALGIQ